MPRILHHLGLSKARYRDWVKRAAAGQLTDQRPAARVRSILPEDNAAVLTYALAHSNDGYRRLTWQMIDADVACLSESSVYRILNDANLLARWKRHRSAGPAPAKPERPHQRWHTDLMYLRIADSWYFMVTVLTGGGAARTAANQRGAPQSRLTWKGVTNRAPSKGRNALKRYKDFEFVLARHAPYNVAHMKKRRPQGTSLFMCASSR